MGYTLQVDVLPEKFKRAKTKEKIKIDARFLVQTSASSSQLPRVLAGSTPSNNQYAVEDGLIEKPFWDELVANICLRNMDAKDEKFSNKASITSTSYHACTIKPRTPADKRERLLPNNLGNRKSPIIVALSHIKFGLRAQSKLFAKAYVAAMPKTWWCPSRETKPFRKDEDTDYLADDDDEETERMRREHERREYATFRYTPCKT